MEISADSSDAVEKITHLDGLRNIKKEVDWRIKKLTVGEYWIWASIKVTYVGLFWLVLHIGIHFDLSNFYILSPILLNK